jgi:hypothetical protein
MPLLPNDGRNSMRNWFRRQLDVHVGSVSGLMSCRLGRPRPALNAILAVCIGIGSMAAGWISNNKIEYGLIPLDSVGMIVTGLLC